MKSPRRIYGAVVRLMTRGLTQAEAVAFNMFLGFFPMLLLAVVALQLGMRVSGAVEEIVERLRWVLPPGSRQVVIEYLSEQTVEPALLLLGIGGTLLFGTQVMIGLIEGFRLVEERRGRESFVVRQLRALALLVVTLVPFLVAVVLTVFGRQVRDAMAGYFGLPVLFDWLWIVVYVGLALVISTLVLTLMYRVGCRDSSDWNSVLPGAVAATLLWWLVNTAFGAYVRQMPYGKFYGGLGAAIGLLIWMYLSAVVVLFGAAYNAECSRTLTPEEPRAPND